MVILANKKGIKFEKAGVENLSEEGSVGLLPYKRVS